MERTRLPQVRTAEPETVSAPNAGADEQSTLGNQEIQRRLRTADGQPIDDGDVLIPSVRGAPDPDTHVLGQGLPVRNASRTRDQEENPAFAPEEEGVPLNPYEGDRTVSSSAPLFDEAGPNYQDPLQGQLGDCYLIASLSAVAQQDPGRIRRMVRPMGPGQYVVTFWVAATEGGVHTFNPHDEIVADEVPSSSTGDPLYGSTSRPTSGGFHPAQRELWVSIVERAYAQWRGGYQETGAGGNAGIALEELTGLESRTYDPQREDPAGLVDAVEEALHARSAVVASTGDDDARCAEHGLFGSHAYSVLSAGQGRLLLRNQHNDPRRGGRRVEVDAETLRACFVEVAVSPVAGATSHH